MLESHLASKLIAWYQKCARELPWRNTKDPYAIWLSEIILQQTQVCQGMDYYYRFMQNYPTVQHLAAASLDDVLRLWQGLGYYSRARNLYAAAQQIVAQGGFPTTYEEIRKLKGVGDYTAAAIASFAFDLPRAAIDGNAYRVLSRCFGIDIPIDSTQGKKHFAALANEVLDKRRPALFNQAIMDLGATICVPRQPKCSECPLADQCVALSEKDVLKYPVKNKRIKVRNRYFVYVVVHSDTHLILQQRGEGDIWQGLFQPPLLEFEGPTDFEEVISHPVVLPFVRESGQWKQTHRSMIHKLTHQTIFADAYSLYVSDLHEVPVGFVKVALDEVGNYGMPRLVLKILGL